MAGRKQEKGEKNPGTMSHFQGGTTAGRLRALIDEYAKKHGLSREQACARYMEQIAVKSGRATYAKGVRAIHPYEHGPAPDNWPPPMEE